MLEVKNINLHYGAAQALRGVSLNAEVGKVTCVLGRNGVGKTSLLRALVGQYPIASGGITFDGEDLNPLKPYERARLGDQSDRVAGSLSHGQKQWLEIGMLLAQDPKLLLVDEPVAGMTDAETFATAELLREIARDHSVVVVEHDMAFVRALGVKVTVLHEGSVLSEGSIDHVSEDPRVVEVYLGR